MSNEIILVMKDDGGTTNVLPICRDLINRKHGVRIFTNGRANERLRTEGLQYVEVETVDEVLSFCPDPVLLVTSMCSDGGVGRDLVPILRGKCPTVAIQDFWGGRLVNTWSHPRFRPDYITVNDSFGANLVLKAWPEFNSSHIIQTGYPMFDKYSQVNLEKQISARREIVTKIKVNNDNILIVFFPCGVLVGASELLREVLCVLQNILETEAFPQLVLVPKVHPRLKNIAPEEFEPWFNALSEFDKLFSGSVILDENIVRADIKTLIMASDVIVSDYSTTLLEAGLIGSRVGGKINISVMYPRVVVKEFTDEFGTLMSEPPFVTLDCTLRAADRNHFQGLLTSAMFDDCVRINLGINQKKHLITDGKNTERTTSFLVSLIN